MTHLRCDFPDGSSLSHPVADPDSILKVYSWLSPLVGEDATWSCSEGDGR